MTIAIGTTVMAPGEALKGENVEMVASRHSRPEEMEAYERVLGDAMAEKPPSLPVRITGRSLANS